MSPRRLEVLVNDRVVGMLSESDDVWRFDYAKAWIESPDAFDLSPALARSQPTHVDGASTRSVQWYFDNLLPEERLRAVIAAEAGIDSEDAFGLLARYGAESAGSLVLRDPDAPPVAERGLRPLAFDDLSRRIAALPRASLIGEAPKRMSLAGAQHKLLVVVRDGRLFEPIGATASTHILKPDHPDAAYPASVANEYFAMRLARAVGLEVPPVRRIYVPQPVYIIERFDRIADANDAAQRRHVIDACQLLDKARAFKYSAARLDALASAAELCRARASARVRLYRWIVFNLIVGNDDNHLKNLSFLIDADGIHLAPHYDLLGTAVYHARVYADDAARWPDVPLSLALGEANRFATVTRAHVVEAARALGLARSTAERELDRLVRAIPLEATRIAEAIEAEADGDIAASPDRRESLAHRAAEQRMIDALRHIVIADMVKKLA